MRTRAYPSVEGFRHINVALCAGLAPLIRIRILGVTLINSARSLITFVGSSAALCQAISLYA